MSRAIRWFYFAAGLLMLALGIIGALLPVMPTTVFLIMSVFCFSRSSPRLEQWLLQHPRFGAPLRLWREQGAISKRGKQFASLGMAIGFTVFWLEAHPSRWLLIGVATFFIVSAWYVLSRPSPKDQSDLTSMG